MGRWEPNARGRLEQAALELYVEHGFEPTTVAEIARRAGLTERTFFRYFADKREVLFWGAGALQEFFVTAVAAAPDGATPIDAMAVALDAVGGLFLEHYDSARPRWPRRPLGPRHRPARPAGLHPGVARRAESRSRRHIIAVGITAQLMVQLVA